MYGFFSAWVPPPRPDPEPHQPAEPSRRRRRPRHRTPRAWNLHLESTGTDIATRYLTESPAVATLAVEDLCWQAAAEDWKRRRPHRWRSQARADWLAEGELLAVEAERLRELADDVFQEL
jgi:hypothetical protein